MSVASNIRGILSLKKDNTVSAIPEPSPLQQRMDEEQRISREAAELQRRCNELEKVKHAVDAPRQKLQTLKRRKLEAQAQALIRETTYDVTAISGEIAATEHEVTQLQSEADVADAALVTLTAQLQEKHALLASMRADGMRMRVRGLEEQLADFAPEFKEALEAYKRVIIEMSALALARDKLGPNVPGNSMIGSVGLTSLTVYVPRVPAYQGIGGTFRLDGPAEARMKEILDGLGVRA